MLALIILAESYLKMGWILWMPLLIIINYAISVISRIELYAYSDLSTKDNAIIDIFTSQATILNIDDEIVEKTILLRKKYKTKLPDAIIAATALCFNYTLITRNSRDFKNIIGLKQINPHEL